ncbi:GNAT family N-acetyltransferase [soil metagenome]
MLIEETVTYLEMTSPDQLVPGSPAPTPVEIERLDETSTEALRSTYARIAGPLGWIDRRDWPEERWRELMSRPGFAAWVARAGGEVAGMVELDVAPDGDVEIAVFGLVPEFVAKGYGGHLLTRGTLLAWKAKTQHGIRTKRVWLHTSSRDHPHARRNYERRGFRPFRTERRQREIPD